MLTIHDCTFEVRWAGWSKYTPYAEQVSQAVMMRLLNMSPQETMRLARSQRALSAMSLGARLAIEKLLAKRGANVPYNGVIALEVVSCPKE